MPRHRTTDPACTLHRPPRTWWQRLRYERGRGKPCRACEVVGYPALTSRP